MEGPWLVGVIPSKRLQVLSLGDKDSTSYLKDIR